MRILSLYFILAFAISARSQGIFVKTGTWQDAIDKAKKENKYIFVDCFATWCGPCIMMDKDVFSDTTVSNYLSAHFISIRIQMDSSIRDGDQVKAWYKQAKDVQRLYGVSAFPTFLFFNQEGTAVHRGLGFKSASDFIILAKEATDTAKQYFLLVNRYRAGVENYAMLRQTAEYARSLGDLKLADSMAHDYLNNYLYDLPHDKLYSSVNIKFMASLLNHSSDPGFEMFYHNRNDVDRLTRPGFSRDIVDFIISKEEIDSPLRKCKEIGDEPDWNGLARKIGKKYNNDDAHRCILYAKLGWYQYYKNWKEYSTNLVIWVENYGSLGIGSEDMQINNNAWDIFQHSNNKRELEIALKWVKRSVDGNANPDPADVDTEANLLYKMGKKKQAMDLEKKAVRLAPENKEICDNLVKMKSNKHTW